MEIELLRKFEVVLTFVLQLGKVPPLERSYMVPRWFWTLWSELL